jgi:hypothetical protein
MNQLIQLRTAFISLCLFSLAYIAQAQHLSYDPMLNQAVKVLEAPERNGTGEFIWYPGQLSAHLQQKRLKESGERCVNVGYPGKFYAPLFNSSFRKEVNFQSETLMKWVSTGKVKVVVNGKESDSRGGAMKLPKGKTVLLFAVTSENNLPALKVSFNGKTLVDGWKASLDGSEWNFAETSPVFGTAGRMPLDDPETILEIKPDSVWAVQNATIENQIIKIQPNGYVLVDFHYLEMGKVTFKAKGKGKITASVGESPKEALNENTKTFEQFPIEPYSLSETQRQIILPERAVRNVKISSDEGCEISNITFKAKVWPVGFKMSFECNDQRINNIWNASVATLHSSTHGFYLDGIKRDYLPWSMDAVLSTFGGDYLFGDEQVSRNSLSVAMLPLNPQKTDLGIPDYPLHALIGFNHYYKRYGDFNTIISYRNRIEQLLQFYETIQDERGFISSNVGSSWGFIPGWATKRGPDKKGTPTYAQIMLYYNFKIGADFAEKWGDMESAKHYRTKAETLKKSIMENFWDDQKGLFVNGFTQNGELDLTISHHAQYWAILADIFPENRLNNLFEVLPKIPYYRDVVSYEKGYEFLAYSKARKVREMWSFLFDVFGDWLDQGYTRFPENFSYKKPKDEQLVFYNRPFGLSLCHGANGVPGVVAVLNGIAGFSQSDSELNHYSIRPDMMDLEWANIEFPIKEGKIKLKLLKAGKTQIEIPEDCKVDFIDKNNSKTTLMKKGVYNLSLLND